MQFLNTLTLWQWVILLAVPPAIVALYFLKLRRQPLEVPSTYLWHKSIEDLHVNSLWQRIRRSLLLYLQLLLVILVILALVRPGWKSGNLLGERFIVLIDNSASMNATDVVPSRLEEAKQRALSLVDEMVGGDQAMIISFSDTARIQQGFTDDRHALRRAVEDVVPTHRSTVLDEALRVVVGVAAPSRTSTAGDEGSAETQPVQLFILSDGRFPPVKDVPLAGLRPVFVPIGSSSAANLALTALGVGRNEDRPGRLQAFGRIENFGDEEVTTTVELMLDGNPIDAAQVRAFGTQSTGVTFDLGEGSSGVLEARLTHADALVQDNRAWAAVDSSHKPRVLLVTAGDEPLETALSTGRAAALAEVTKVKPEYLKTDKYREAAAGGVYDLVIYDRCAPEQLPRANTFFIGAAPPAPDAGATVDQSADSPESAASAPGRNAAAPGGVGWWSLGRQISYPQIIDLNHAHPLLQWVDMGDVEIAEARVVSPPPGGARLIDSNQGTLLAIAERDSYEDAVLGFPIYDVDAAGEPYANTNWPIRGSFPSFVFAVLNYLGGSDAARANQNVKPGQSLLLKGEAAQNELTVRTPSGATVSVPRGRSGTFSFGATDEPGPYDVLEEGRVTQRFAVNLFDPLESDIRPSKDNSIQIGYQSIEGSPDFEPARRETWKWLLGAALVVLVAEWYIYNRRVYI